MEVGSCRGGGAPVNAIDSPQERAVAMNLRIAQAGDARELVTLFEQLGYACASSELSERIATRVDHLRSEIFVAEERAAIVGVIVLNIILPIHEAGKWGVVSALVVNESARGKGIGTALLEHAELHAKKSGCTKIELSSNESRTEAHAFYEKNGLVEMRKRFVKRHAS
jgi:GNAT superfamily N-acetyltransferase